MFTAKAVNELLLRPSIKRMIVPFGRVIRFAWHRQYNL